jgi:hypothetical protein
MKTVPSGKPFHPPNRETSEVGFGPKMPLEVPSKKTGAIHHLQGQKYRAAAGP